MASSIWKLKALIKKNLLEMRRNMFSTLCEIFFPIILIFLLYWLKTVFEVETYEFEKEEGTLEDFIKNRSVSNVDSFNQTSFNWYGMSILPNLMLCSEFNKKHKIRPIIATIGVPTEIKNKLIEDSLAFKDNIKFSLDNSSFKDFESEKEMHNYIQSKLYGENENYTKICMGISMEEDSNNHKYNYSLHYFENEVEDGADDVPKSKYLKDQFQSNSNEI